MANSRYEYVKSFERENILLPETHIIIRVDGRGFHKFSKFYNFEKPNDERALKVINLSAKKLMDVIPDIIVAYGDSDEYSFLLRKDCELFERREFKLITTFSSTFSAYYQFYWNQLNPDRLLNIERLPTFDARAIVYPNNNNVIDYFRWRQVDCHINNLYNTTFWTLVIKGGLTNQEAENRLIGTLSADKNEILFKEFGINYNNESEMYKKGTIYVKEYIDFPISKYYENPNKENLDRLIKRSKKTIIKEYNCDIIKDKFWTDKPYLLN
jgi:tRNA(His) guanylyltransferase